MDQKCYLQKEEQELRLLVVEFFCSIAFEERYLRIGLHGLQAIFQIVFFSQNFLQNYQRGFVNLRLIYILTSKMGENKVPKALLELLC